MHHILGKGCENIVATTKQYSVSSETIDNVVYGSAYADAWGYVTEFWTKRMIDVIQPSAPQLLVISDDTQMSIYTMIAVQEILETITAPVLSHHAIYDPDGDVADTVRKIFAEHYLVYLDDPDNVRAPGRTVTQSLKRYKYHPLEYRVYGDEGAKNTSLGCGTIMRTGWLGLLDLPECTLFWLACLASQVTHGHPLSWAVAGLHTINTHRLAYGKANTVMSDTEMNQWLLLATQMFYREGWQPEDTTRFTDNLAQNIQVYIKLSGEDSDVCDYMGAGWAADETLACALAVWKKYGHTISNETFEQAIKTLVYTRGDSDSLAQVGACYFGAVHPGDAFRKTYEQRFEPRYIKELEFITALITDLNNTLCATQ